MENLTCLVSLQRYRHSLRNVCGNMIYLINTFNPHWEGQALPEWTWPKRRVFGYMLKLIDGPLSLGVGGLRRIGKTTLLKQLVGELSANRVPSYQGISRLFEVGWQGAGFFRLICYLNWDLGAGEPLSRPSVLKSSSMSGQWMPYPPAQGCQFERCSGLALSNLGYHTNWKNKTGKALLRKTVGIVCPVLSH